MPTSQSRWSRLTLFVITVAFASGCSLAYTSAPDPSLTGKRDSEPRCNTSKLAPVLDVVAAANSSVGALVLSYAATQTESSGPYLGFEIGLIALVAGVAYKTGSSAVTGFDNVERCRRAHTLYQESAAAGAETVGVFAPAGAVSMDLMPAQASTP